MSALRAIVTPAEQLKQKDAEAAELRRQVDALTAQARAADADKAQAVAAAEAAAAARSADQLAQLQTNLADAKAASANEAAKAHEREAALQVLHCLACCLNNV